MRDAFERVVREMPGASSEGTGLESVIFSAIQRVDDLKKRVRAVDQDSSIKNYQQKEHLFNRLDQIRHGITELQERMNRPYIVSPALQAVKQVLDTLAEAGECNSIILEGEPGTGKTQWAYAEVAEELREGKDSVLIHIRVKAGMTAQELLYSVDNISRLNDAQMPTRLSDEMAQEAREWKLKIAQGKVDSKKNAEFLKFKARMKAVQELGETDKDLDVRRYIQLGPLGEAIRQSALGKKVWLILDEVEKGDVELMTGILDEIENLTFTLPTGDIVQGNKEHLRIVITTNPEESDKIPPSFRRRSLYHFVEYPTREEMKKIIESNFPHLQEELLRYAIDTFYAYHNHSRIEKKPSTPELLAWIAILAREYNGKLPDTIPHKEILLKYRPDHAINPHLERIQKEQKKQEQMRQAETRTERILNRVIQGKKVFRLWDEIFQNEYAQHFLTSLYAELDALDYHFVTPQFTDEVDDDGYTTGKRITQQAFQLFAPGFEDLGDGYFVLPKDIQRVLEPILRQKLRLLTLEDFADIGMARDEISFDRIEEKHSRYTRGSLRIGAAKVPSIPNVFRVGKDKFVFSEDYDAPIHLAGFLSEMDDRNGMGEDEYE